MYGGFIVVMSGMQIFVATRIVHELKQIISEHLHHHHLSTHIQHISQHIHHLAH
jgi:hypothetical protein